MSVDVSGLIEAIDRYAVETWDCVGERLASIGSAEAPKDTGNLAGSVEWTGAAGGGGSVVGVVSVGAEYAFYTTQEVLHGHPLMVWEGDDGLIFAREVHPSAPDWWDNTLQAFPEAIGGCE